MPVHYRPADGFLGDVIPFYWHGEYHLFYLKAPLGAVSFSDRARTSWEHIVSVDLVHWKEKPSVLNCGEPSSPDQDGVWTGSVVEREGVFHLFYTGYNSKNLDRPQMICHATSEDLVRWKKDPNNPTLGPDIRWYETKDWRDPYVFWNDDQNCYWMLIAARIRSGPILRRGCIALATSNDLESWRIHTPLWAPYLTYCMECPDLFRWDDCWYLVFSKFSERAQTCYRLANELKGPWQSRIPEGLDGRRFYAAKTLWDGKNRFAFGWVPTRIGEKDDGPWEWGGDLAIPRQLVKLPDATLTSRCPQTVLESYRKEITVNFESKLGEWEHKNQKIYGKSLDGFGYGFIPLSSREFVFEVSITLPSNSSSAGILLKAQSDLAGGYMVAIEPSRNRVIFDRWPQPVERQWEPLVPFKKPYAEIDGSPLIERPLSLALNRPIKCQVFVSNTIIEAFIDNQVALTYRVYEFSPNPLGLFVEEGSAQFDEVVLRTPF